MNCNPFKPFAALAISLLLLASCGKKNDTADETVLNVHHSPCTLYTDKGFENPDSLNVSYSDGTLHVIHRNLFVNCGTAELDGDINVTVSIDGSTINIYETEDPDNPQANCMCEVDNEFDITGITAGSYTLTFHNWYPEPRSFSFTF